MVKVDGLEIIVNQNSNPKTIFSQTTERWLIASVNILKSLYYLLFVTTEYINFYNRSIGLRFGLYGGR